MNVSVAVSKEECAQKLLARFAPENIVTNNNQYFYPYYGMQSYGRTPIYGPYWQPNVYRSMQVFPAFKQDNHQVCRTVNHFVVSADYF